MTVINNLQQKCMQLSLIFDYMNELQKVGKKV